MKSDFFEQLVAATRDLPPPPDSRTIEPDRNSMLYWLPRLPRDIPAPRTEVVRFDNRLLWPAMDGLPIPDMPWDTFEEAALRIGFPCFVRTDQSSAKHSGPLSYRLDSLSDLRRVLVSTFEDNCLKDLTVLAFAFREWLDLESPFRAFGCSPGEGHPIAREWRVFADSGRVWCKHFYWPAHAIAGNNPTDKNWRTLRTKMARRLAAPDLRHLQTLARGAVESLGEDPKARWSVDFAQDRSGKWWLIDMAIAEASWHPHCRHK